MSASQPRLRSTTKSTTKRKQKTHSHLETLVSNTKKLSVEDLLELYRAYDQLVMDYSFKHLLLPYTRFARTWLKDQIRDLCAGTDRNRLILTARSRRSAEMSQPQQYSDVLKPKHDSFVRHGLHLLSKLEIDGVSPELIQQVLDLGVSRLVFDDLGLYIAGLSNRYPEQVADWCSAASVGDHDEMLEIEAATGATLAEIGVRQQDAWYVLLNNRSCYDQIDRIVQTVCLGFGRLLFRFAHQLRGHTSTEENFSAGYEGLVRACRNYDPVDGSSFTAHSQLWVRSAILQRQRQASVISLPNTTWYRLAQMEKGQAPLSEEQVSSLKERAEMFYTASANTKVAEEDAPDIASYESIHVTSPDAEVVLGDSLYRSQSVEDIHEASNLASVGSEVAEQVITFVNDEDPTLLFSVLLWALNAGIDSTLLAELTAPLFISEHKRQLESAAHSQMKHFQVTLNSKHQKKEATR